MEKLFISGQSRYFNFNVIIYKTLFPTSALAWRVNNFVSRQEKVKFGEMRVQMANLVEPYNFN